MLSILASIVYYIGTMRYLIVMLFLLLVGCATVSSDELLEIATTCGIEPECDEHWEAWNRREDMLERRRLRDMPLCPSDETAFCEVYGGSKNCTCLSELPWWWW